MNYLPVEIIKGSYTCSINLSEKCKKFVIECESGHMKESDIIGYMKIRLVHGNLPNTIKAIILNTENIPVKYGKGPMFGGYHVHTSDSRYSEICKKIVGLDAHFSYPTPLHDRFES